MVGLGEREEREREREKRERELNYILLQYNLTMINVPFFHYER